MPRGSRDEVIGDYKARIRARVNDLALEFDAIGNANWTHFRAAVNETLASIERDMNEVAVELEHEEDED